MVSALQMDFQIRNDIFSVWIRSKWADFVMRLEQTVQTD